MDKKKYEFGELLARIDLLALALTQLQIKVALLEKKVKENDKS